MSKDTNGQRHNGTPGRRRSQRTTIGAAAATTLSVVPPFLSGSLLPFMRDDLDINTTRLGAVVAVYFTAGALAAVPGGRLAERLGAKRAILLTNSCTATSLLAVALLAHNWVHLLIALTFAGVANGMLQPAGNLAVMRGVDRPRQGLAFGVKQAAGPTGTLLAGLAIPLIAVTVGWRWAFAAGVVPLPVIAVLLPREDPSDRSRGSKPQPLEATGTLVRIAAGAGFGFAAATTIGTFFIDSVVSAGGAAETGALALTSASITCILVRLVAGWQSDRFRDFSRHLVAGLMALGSLGFVALAFSTGPLLWVPGVILGLAAGWGWPGLLYFSVAAANPSAPAAATGVTTVGVAIGAAAGPLLFGVAAAQVSFSFAWLLSGIMALLAAGFLIDAMRRETA